MSVSAKAGVLRIRPGATASELRQHLMRLCESLGYNPLEALIKMATDGYEVEVDGKILMMPLDAKDAIAIHKEIAGYIMPKLRTIDVKEKVDVDINITVQKFGEVKTIEGEARMIKKVIDTEATEPADLEKMKKDELIAFAQTSLGIELAKSHTKEELIEKIQAAIEAEAEDDEDNDDEE